MTIEQIGVGAAPGDGTGDGLRTAMTKVNNNFSNSSHAASKLTGTDAGQIPLAENLNGRNLLINGDFSINQINVSGTVALASGEYGHDGFKAGSGGCTYTFSKTAGVTTLAISAGTLVQIIETENHPSLTAALSWVGTAEGRINGGSYGNSGLTGVTTGGSNDSVEFNTGTLSLAQFEYSSASTDFDYIPPADQLTRCNRYFQRIVYGAFGYLGSGQARSADVLQILLSYTEKRTNPVITSSAITEFNIAIGAGSTPVSSLGAFQIDVAGCKLEIDGVSVFTANDCLGFEAGASGAFIDIDARL